MKQYLTFTYKGSTVQRQNRRYYIMRENNKSIIGLLPYLRLGDVKMAIINQKRRGL